MNNNTYNQNTTTITYTYGGETQKKQKVIRGKNMKQNLSEYKQFLGAKHRKNNTINRYYDSAKKLTQHITHLDKNQLQKYITHLHQHHRPNTVTSHIVGINQYLTYIGRLDLRIPTPKWRPIHRDTINRDQIIQLIQHAKTHYSHMDYTILLMIRDLDCRNHEILKAQWNWIHDDKIHFQDCKTGDTTGRLTPELQQALQHLQQTTPYKDSYIFHIPHGAHRGQPIGKTGLYIKNLVNRITQEVIGRPLNPQDLRASIITAEYTAYVNPKIIQLKARHRSEKTTQRYNHIDETIILEYLNTGTIFNPDTEPISKPDTKTADNKINKRGYIKTYPDPEPTIAPTPINTGEPDTNHSVGFSFSLFKHLENLERGMIQ